MPSVQGLVKHRARELAKTCLSATLGRSGLQLRRQPGPLIAEPERELRPTLGLLAAEAMLEVGPELFVVQIGAFDGVSNDPVHRLISRHGWRGVLVEPQVRYFDALSATYSGQSGVRLVNAAIAAHDGTQTLYSIDPDPLDPTPDAGQFASFDKAHLLKQADKFPNLLGRLRTSDVPCVTFERLLEDVERVDVLQIDTEGFDAQVLELFDLARWRPRVVQFEHVHLKPKAHAACVRRLFSHGYRVWSGRQDTLAHQAAA